MLPMQPPHVQLPRPGLLGPDPEPLGTERYERLMARVRDEQEASKQVASATRMQEQPSAFEAVETRPLTLSAS